MWRKCKSQKVTARGCRQVVLPVAEAEARASITQGVTLEQGLPIRLRIPLHHGMEVKLTDAKVTEGTVVAGTALDCSDGEHPT